MIRPSILRTIKLTTRPPIALGWDISRDLPRASPGRGGPRRAQARGNISCGPRADEVEEEVRTRTPPLTDATARVIVSSGPRKPTPPHRPVRCDVAPQPPYRWTRS